MAENENKWSFDGFKILGAVALQAALLIYYIGSTNATYNARFDAETVRFETDERRILSSEEAIQQLNRTESQIMERLARLDEKQEQALETSRRIETYVQGLIRNARAK